jgi:hypothetical protein
MPAIVLAIATLAVNFLGDGLNDALNPRARTGAKTHGRSTAAANGKP